MESMEIDGIAVPVSMLDATKDYDRYVRAGGKRPYQDYIQRVERAVDGGKKTALGEFMVNHFDLFQIVCLWSNEYWKAVESAGGMPSERVYMRSCGIYARL